MRKIEVLVHSDSLEPLRVALIETGLSGMTVTEVRVYAPEGGIVLSYRGAKITTNFRSRFKVEVVCPQVMLAAVLEAIGQYACLDAQGQPEILSSSIERVINIRTGVREYVSPQTRILDEQTRTEVPRPASSRVPVWVPCFE